MLALFSEEERLKILYFLAVFTYGVVMYVMGYRQGSTNAYDSCTKVIDQFFDKRKKINESFELVSCVYKEEK